MNRGTLHFATLRHDLRAYALLGVRSDREFLTVMSIKKIILDALLSCLPSFSGLPLLPAVRAQQLFLLLLPLLLLLLPLLLLLLPVLLLLLHLSSSSAAPSNGCSTVLLHLPMVVAQFCSSVHKYRTQESCLL